MLGGVDAGLDGVLEGRAKEGAALVQSLPFAKGDDLVGGGGLGELAHLGDEGDGGFDGQTLGVVTVVESGGRHDSSSLIVFGAIRATSIPFPLCLNL